MLPRRRVKGKVTKGGTDKVVFAVFRKRPFVEHTAPHGKMGRADSFDALFLNRNSSHYHHPYTSPAR